MIRLYIKAWQGHFCILNSIHTCCIYTKEIKDILGIGIDHYTIISAKGFSEGFVANDETKQFGKSVAKMLSKRLSKKWAQKLRRLTDRIEQIFNSKTYTQDSYKTMQELMVQYITIHGAIKYCGDYTTKQIRAIFAPARKYCEPAYNNYEKFLAQYAFLIGRKNRCPAKLVLACTPAEINRYHGTGKLPPRNTLKRRLDKTAIIITNGKYKLSTGKRAEKIENNLSGYAKILHGTPAYPGLVLGPAKIIKSYMNQSIKSGEILVTGMTRAEYSNLFRKAAAVVTDSGGLLSHAAITARELKKPCVVGTRSATKSLHDGDFIEVDANKGRVSLIKGEK